MTTEKLWSHIYRLCQMRDLTTLSHWLNAQYLQLVTSVPCVTVTRVSLKGSNMFDMTHGGKSFPFAHLLIKICTVPYSYRFLCQLARAHNSSWMVDTRMDSARLQIYTKSRLKMCIPRLSYMFLSLTESPAKRTFFHVSYVSYAM